MSGATALHVAVAGGSIGGLCAGVALHGVGCTVDVFERTPYQMTSRGAGIVVQNDLLALLQQHNTPKLPMTSCTNRLYLEYTGGEGKLTAMPQHFTSWEAIYKTLRSAFPDEHYHLGKTVTDFASEADRVSIQFADGQAYSADLLVCADGIHSKARRRLLPDVHPQYAGYVAFRGTLAEGLVDGNLVDFFDDRFTFCNARSGGHILCYLIPGDGASTEPGQRRLNWVWYVHIAEGAELSALLTDAQGQQHESSLGPGELPESRVVDIHTLAEQELHPQFARLVQATPDPFVQSIIDVVVPQMVFGRVCLLGDAAFVVRPHTAAAAAKAADDASALAMALSSSPTNLEYALGMWEQRQRETGQNLTNYGVRLGSRWAKPN